MKTFSKTASVVLALTMVQCACGICAHAEEATAVDYSKCTDGIHYSDTTTGNTTIDVKTATAAALKEGIKNAQIAVNKVDHINGEFNAADGDIYVLQNGTQLTAVKGLTGVTSTIGEGNAAAIVDQSATNGKIATKLPLISGITPTVDVSANTNDTVAAAVVDGKTVVGKVIIGGTTPDTTVVTATNNYGTVTSTTTASDTAAVYTGTPKVIAQKTIASATGLLGQSTLQKIASVINVGRFVGTTDTQVSNTLSTTLGGKSVATVTDVNDVTNAAKLQNGLGVVTNQGEVKTTTTATPKVSAVISTISALLPQTTHSVSATADVKTTSTAATASDTAVTASTVVNDTAAVKVDNFTAVDHSGQVTVTNTVTPNATAAQSILNNVISTVTSVASGKTTVADAVKATATAATPDTITVSGSGKTTVDVTFGTAGTKIVASNTGSVNVTAANKTLGSASTNVSVDNSTTTVNVPSANTLLNSVFGSAE